MVRPLLVVEENCQLRTSATWSHVATGGLVKKFTFCTASTHSDYNSSPKAGEEVFSTGSTRGRQLTFGWLVSMLYHRIEAQAFGIWQMLEMTTTGRE